MFRPSEFHELFQPSYCRKRVWLRSNRPELAEDDTEFVEMLQRRGKLLEERHLAELGPVKTPSYPIGDLDTGAKATKALIDEGVEFIYQGVLKSHDGRFEAIPDFLVQDMAIGQYRIRDVKLAVRLQEHPEIGFQLGLYRDIFEDLAGYSPVLEVVKGDGELVSPFEAPTKDLVFAQIDEINHIRSIPDEFEEPVKWSKCCQCLFRGYCWETAVKEKDIATVIGIEQGMWIALRNIGVRNYADLAKLTSSELSGVMFSRGKGTQKLAL